jgi:hypothetical protein
MPHLATLGYIVFLYGITKQTSNRVTVSNQRLDNQWSRLKSNAHHISWHWPVQLRPPYTMLWNKWKDAIFTVFADDRVNTSCKSHSCMGAWFDDPVSTPRVGMVDCDEFLARTVHLYIIKPTVKQKKWSQQNKTRASHF